MKNHVSLGNALSLEQVADELHRLGITPKRRHASTFHRWAVKGQCGVLLEHLRVGKRILTSIEAVEVYMRAVAEAKQAQSSRGTASPGHAKAEAELDAAGIR